MIRLIIQLYIFLIIIDAILSFFPQYRNHEIVAGIRKIADYSLKPIRKLLPPDLPIDISPLVVIILLKLLMILW